MWLLIFISFSGSRPSVTDRIMRRTSYAGERTELQGNWNVMLSIKYNHWIQLFSQCKTWGQRQPHQNPDCIERQQFWLATELSRPWSLTRASIPSPLIQEQHLPWLPWQQARIQQQQWLSTQCQNQTWRKSPSCSVKRHKVERHSSSGKQEKRYCIGRTFYYRTWCTTIDLL